MKKRVFSLLLALALLCSLLPQIAPPVHADTPYSGSCGQNLTWTFDPDTGTLSFQGSGDMYGYGYASAPWFPYNEEITTVTFPVGLTSIGAHAFYYCENITEFTLPNGLKSIGYAAFRGCKSITEITIPEGITRIPGQAFLDADNLRTISLPGGITSIEESAFFSCDSLAELTLPAKLAAIGESVFSYCASLKEIALPASLTSIGDAAFFCCESLTAFSVAAGNPSFSADACGVLFNKQKTVLIQYPCGRPGPYEVPGSVSSIENTAFQNCSALTIITLPAGFTSINDWMFSGCTGMTEISLPAGLTTIGSYAFYNCSGLREIILPGSLASVGYGAFENCNSIEDLYFGGSYEQWDALQVSVEANRIHWNTTDPTSHWTFEEQAPTCTEYGYRFKSCSCGYETGEDIPSLGHNYVDGVCTRCGMKDSDNDVSGVCGEKLTWTYDPDRGKLTIEGSGAMDDYYYGYWMDEWVLPPWDEFAYGINTVSLPDGITSIGNYAFYSCDMMSEINLPEGLTAIGEYAFDGCHDVAFSLPSSLKKIGRFAFRGCGMTELVIPEGIAAIPDYAFISNFNLETVVLPATVTSIGYRAFFGSQYLTSIVIPSSVVSLDIYSQALGYYTDDGWSTSKVENFTIYGYSGTAAETYANENGFRFVPIAQCAGEHSYVKGVCTRCGYAAQSASDIFTDVPDGKFYSTPVLWAIRAGVTSGTDESHFGPKDTCTRGHVVTFLWNMMGQPEPDMNDNPFVDVPEGKFYTKAVLWAYQNNVTSGVDDTHFNPKGNCTRAHVVTFLWNAKGQPDPKAEDTPFVDVKPNKFYTKAVLWAYQNGVTSGLDDTHFGTSQTCTRGQVVTFLYNAFVG